MADNMNPTEKIKGNGKWAQHKAEDAVSTVNEVYETAKDAGAELVNQANRKARRLVNEYPMSALLGGIAVGMILGASLFRRRV